MKKHVFCLACNKNSKCVIDNFTQFHLRKEHPELTCTKDYYDKFIRKNSEGVCLSCKKPTSFRSYGKGYSKYCSEKCAQNDNKLRNKIKETWIKIYGVDNPSKHPSIKKKKEKTTLKNYGVSNGFQTKKSKDIHFVRL